MKYSFLPRMMWCVFQGTFTAQLRKLTTVPPKVIMRGAQKRYRGILASIPEFERNDPFFINLLSAAMLAAIYLELPEKPPLEQITAYYHRAMTGNSTMRLYLHHRNSYTPKARHTLSRQAFASQFRNNPYTWKFSYKPGPDLNSYTATFFTCGIKRLFDELGISEITPAMCTYDYDMAELSGSVFSRHYTLANGGPYCDCHYQRRT